MSWFLWPVGNYCIWVGRWVDGWMLIQLIILCASILVALLFDSRLVSLADKCNHGIQRVIAAFKLYLLLCRFHHVTTFHMEILRLSKRRISYFYVSWCSQITAKETARAKIIKCMLILLTYVFKHYKGNLLESRFKLWYAFCWEKKTIDDDVWVIYS